jgi:polyisoprenoid-binding protein YceI
MIKETYKVDVGKSQAFWTGRRLALAQHGSIHIRDGALEVVDEILNTGHFTLDIRSIQVSDLMDPDEKIKLQNHLLSEDFFAAEQYPYAYFTIISTQADMDGSYRIDGDLTIKGITRPLSFDTQVEITRDWLKAAAHIIVDRTEYNMRFRSAKFYENLGDLLIYDDFILDVELFANARQILESEDLDLANII